MQQQGPILEDIKKKEQSLSVPREISHPSLTCSNLAEVVLESNPASPKQLQQTNVYLHKIIKSETTLSVMVPGSILENGDLL